MLQLKNTDELGEYIVVQGGTMRNDSIVRALEKLTGKQISRSDCPELMGALGLRFICPSNKKHIKYRFGKYVTTG